MSSTPHSDASNRRSTEGIKIFSWGPTLRSDGIASTDQKGGPPGPPHDKELKPGKNKGLGRPARRAIAMLVVAVLMTFLEACGSGATIDRHRAVATASVTDTVVIGSFWIASTLEVTDSLFCISGSVRDTLRNIYVPMPRQCWPWASLLGAQESPDSVGAIDTRPPPADTTRGDTTGSSTADSVDARASPGR